MVVFCCSTVFRALILLNDTIGWSEDEWKSEEHLLLVKVRDRRGESVDRGT